MIKIRKASLCSLFAASLVAMASQSAFAQEEPTPTADEADSTVEADATDDPAAVTDDAAADDDADEGADDDADESEDDDEGPQESAHGSYEWKPSWGAGVEAGIFFNSLSRWNTNLLEDQAQFDTDIIWHFDAAVEASFLEGTRLTLFGGYTTPFGDNPSLGAWYIGLEPAFALRRDQWEMALGIGAALGKANVSVDPDLSADTKVLLLRPFLEVRRYLSTSAALYVRGGFNQWLPFDVEGDGLSLGSSVQANTNSDEINEGGPYLALGVRFGSYPEHIKIVPDTDGDGLRDDVDECPEEPGPAENNGCPWDDADGDGVPDKDDKCPDEAGPAENDGCPIDTDGDGIPDKDDNCPEVPGPAENDGCPWPDRDGDGVPDKDDQCPDVAGPAENNGCPLDSDGDGVLDTEDECPYQAGPADNNGCPIQRVVVTMKRIKIGEKVYFDLNKATIQQQSYDLLNEIAQVIKDNPRIKKIEIQGHTDMSGKAEYNQKLSQERAQAVYDYLVEQGVDAERLTAKGYGQSQPLVPLAEGQKKESKEDAAKNRRVEFVIREQDEIKKTIRRDLIPEDAVEVREIDETAPAEDVEDAEKPAEDNTPEEAPAAE